MKCTQNTEKLYKKKTKNNSKIIHQFNVQLASTVRTS